MNLLKFISQQILYLDCLILKQGNLNKHLPFHPYLKAVYSRSGICLWLEICSFILFILYKVCLIIKLSAYLNYIINIKIQNNFLIENKSFLMLKISTTYIWYITDFVYLHIFIFVLFIWTLILYPYFLFVICYLLFELLFTYCNIF